MNWCHDYFSKEQQDLVHGWFCNGHTGLLVDGICDGGIPRHSRGCSMDTHIAERFVLMSVKLVVHMAVEHLDVDNISKPRWSARRWYYTLHFVALEEHKYWSIYSLEEHVSAKSWCILVIAFCKDFKAGSRFLEFCWIKLPWALHSSCHKRITIHEWDRKIQTTKMLMWKESLESWSYEGDTWHHRSMNSKCGQLSRRSANASITLCKYL